MAQVTYAKTAGGVIIARKTVSDADMIIKPKLDRSGYKLLTTIPLDSENYTGTPELTEDATTITEDWANITPTTTVNIRKKQFDIFVKTLGAGMITTAKYWINDYFGELDPTNPKKAEWEQYIVDLKAAYGTIKAEVVAIANYDALIAYIKCEPDPLVDGWRKHLPTQPEAE